MATFYISTTGVDDAGRNGSVGQEWATLGYACTRVTTNGDIIHINVGTYYQATEAQLSAGVSVEGSGTASTIIISQVNTTYGGTLRLASGVEGTNGNQHISGVFFNGNSLTTYCAIWVLARSNVEIYNCKFEDYNRYGVRFYGETNTTYQPATTYATGNKFYNNVVNNCAYYLAGSGGGGSITIDSQTGFLIYGNTITQNSRPVTNNGCCIKPVYTKGLQIYNNTLTADGNADRNLPNTWSFTIELWDGEGTEVYNNYCYDGEIDIAGGTEAKGTYDFGVSVHDNFIGCSSLKDHEMIGIILEARDELSDILIYNNHIQNVNVGVVFYSLSGAVYERIKIQYNIFENIGKTTLGWNNSWGFLCGSGTTPFTARYWYFDNNVFVSANTSGAFETAAIRGLNRAGCTVDHIYIRNNIIKDWDGYSIYFPTGGSVDYLNIQNNLNHNTGSNLYLGITPTNYTNSGNISGNPLFISDTDFHLQGSSPAINTGLNIGLLYDYDGTPVSDPPEIGAYEYFVGTAPTANFSASDTTVFESQNIDFTDLSTGSPTSWYWDFGDEEFSSDQNPSHSYASHGVYTVTLTATNFYGDDDEVKVDYITVLDAEIVTDVDISSAYFKVSIL